jgi:hypothetical protein
MHEWARWLCRKKWAMTTKGSEEGGDAGMQQQQQGLIGCYTRRRIGVQPGDG